jgi:hypothetical protein
MMKTIILLLAFLSVGKFGSVGAEYVDAIELSHIYDAKGSLIFDQVIFYERTPVTGKFQVRAWCLVEDREHLNRRPVKNEETGIYQVDWYDTDKKILRKLTSRIFRESWSQVDPERADKKFHDERNRIALVFVPIVPPIDGVSSPSGVPLGVSSPSGGPLGVSSPSGVP